MGLLKRVTFLDSMYLKRTLTKGAVRNTLLLDMVMHAILVLERLTQKDCEIQGLSGLHSEFRTNLNYIARSCLKKLGI